MRWERLFEDLDAQWEAEARRELDEEVSDRTRRERAGVELAERLVATRGHVVAVRLLTGESVEGRWPTSGGTGCSSLRRASGPPWFPWQRC